MGQGCPIWIIWEVINMSQNEARGVRFGRPRLVMPEGFSKMVRAWRRGKCTALEAAQKLGISRSTFFRRVRELERERRAHRQEQAIASVHFHLAEQNGCCIIQPRLPRRSNAAIPNITRLPIKTPQVSNSTSVTCGPLPSTKCW